MAEFVASSVLKSIRNLLTKEAAEIAGFQDPINDLRVELMRMQCFLRDADAKATDDDSVGRWVLEVKNICYDVEDLIENYAFKESRRGGSLDKFLKRCVCILNDVYISRKLRSEIRNLKTKISYIQEGFQAYGIRTITVDEASSSSSRQQLLRTYPFLEEEYIVGLESDVDLLVQRLVSEDEHRVVSICGMGGLGKTTLARKVYQHPDVKRYFDGFAWICVSQQWQTKYILESIMKQLAPEKREVIAGKHWSEQELIGQLYMLQKQKRCLIVLDDIWTIEVWECIKSAFPTGQRGSKILLTTRNRSLASHIDPVGFHYQSRLLSDEESWELLQSRALQGTYFEGDKKMQIENLGKQMVKFCGGLPLALVALVGILSTKNPVSEWETVYHSIRNYITKDARYDEGGLLWILALSYNDLPSQLKQCFLYLGSFPEDTNIKAETLYQLWIAEGLVLMEDLDREEESMMDLAERYLAELADRGMVQLQISDVPMIRKFESCRLHDIMRDLCLLKAKEENFFKCIGADVEPFDFLTKSPTYALRRLVINLYPEDILRYFPQGKEMTNHLRMLRIFVPDSLKGSLAKMIESQFNNIEMLRVLSIEGLCPIDMWKLPKAIEKLIHLRYLSLKDSSIVTLPSSLSNLKHLQTLDLRVFKLRRLPNILWKMAGLTYLYLPSLYKLDHQSFKVRLDGLSKLEILENFSDRFCTTNDLSKLTNLQVLIVDCFELGNLEMIANYASSNNRLKHVSVLTDCDFSSNMEKGLTILQQSLFGSKIHCFHSEGAIPKFPEFESSLSSSLVQLTMNLFGLKGDDVMGTLEKLMNLRTLCLWRFEGEQMIFHAKGFPQLKILRLLSFLNMKKWVVEETAMPKLCTLSIWGFTVLEMIPDGLRLITTLRELDIRNMPEKFKARIRTQESQRGEDFEKISHVPLVLS